MLLLVAACIGVGIYCFANQFYVAGVAALLGPSGKIGMVAMLVSGGILVANEEWVAGSVPILVVALNLAALLLKKKPGDSATP